MRDGREYVGVHTYPRHHPTHMPVWQRGQPINGQRERQANNRTEVGNLTDGALVVRMDSRHPAACASQKDREGRLMVKPVVVSVLCFFIGLISGGVLFSQSQPRSVLALHRCAQCLDVNDLAGLLASVGIQQFPRLLPSVVFETDRTIALQVPSTKQGAHYVIVPKKDIKNIGELSTADAPYLLDIFAVAQHLITTKALTNYRITTNGPGFQDVTYLHFHLVTT